MSLRIHSCLAILAVLGLGPLEVSGATFRLPDTSPNPPVSVARVYLEFTADLPADALLVSGSGIGVTVSGFPGVVELARTTAPLVAIDSNVEDIARLFKVGPRAAVLTIDTNRYLERNVAPATGFNRCKPRSGVAGDKEYDIEPVGLGPATVSRFGLTGLAATRFEEAGTVTTYCNCASRRVKGLTWPTPFPGAQDRKRAPMDILVVLDQSGSMAWPMTPGSATARWGALESAMGQFIANWSEETLTPGVELEKPHFQDRLGLVYFSTGTDEPLATSPFFIPRGTTVPGPGHAWKPFETELIARDPAGWTALGQGILYAINKAKTEGITGNDPTIIVMTDGEQTETPRVEPALSGTDIGSLAINDSGTLKALRAQCIPMLTLSVGDVTSPYAELMHQISVETAGTAGLTTGSSLPVDFLQKLVEALKGNTLSMVLKHDGMLPLRVSRATTPVLLDGTVESALVTVSWLGSPNSKPLKLQIINPDGVAAVPTATSSGPTYLTHRVDLPKSGKPGTWRLEVSSSETGLNIPYKLTVLAEEGRLDFRNTVTGLKHPVGQPLTLVTDLTLDGKPVEELSGELRVRMERPVTALGTLLHEVKTRPGETPQTPEPLSAYQLKVNALLKDPDFAEKLGNRLDASALVMKHTGKGRYELTLDDTKFPGTYRFHFELDMKGPEGEPIYRLETVSTVVEVIPNGTVSDVRSEQTGDGQYTLSFLPRDADGNVMGPGYDGRIQVRIDGKGTVKGVANPEVDGNYQVMLADIEKDTPIVLSFAGTPIAQGPVAEPKPMKPGEQMLLPPGGGGSGSGPKPGPGDSCGCRRTSSGGMLGVMGLAVLGFAARRRGRRDDE